MHGDTQDLPLDAAPGVAPGMTLTYPDQGRIVTGTALLAAVINNALGSATM